MAVSSPKKTPPDTAPRRLRTQKRSLRKPKSWIARKPAPLRQPLPKASLLLRKTIKLCRSDWRTLLGITAWYGVLTFVLVRGLSFDTEGLSALDALEPAQTTLWDTAWSKAVQLTSVVSTSFGEGASPTASLYQAIVFVMCSLALIYTFRQLRNNQPVSIRQSFYRGMSQLVPFLLVLLMLSVQLLPIIVAGFIYSTLIVQGVAVHWYEIMLSWAVVLLLLLWSLRMITSSLFALYIATLPDMTPLRALRSAKQLVWKRRLVIWRKFVPFSVVCSLAMLLVLLPFLFWAVGLTPYVVFLCVCLLFTVTHAYFYTLYREML